ncbi:ABC transporter substrate-binding protein [Crocosphaera sp. Alani8]|uniref:ABC transporter substrate-binding protein n=1 Tax=Crocosphaera sp. Alani8 TaxID=3038952 RepID=UPI00313B74D7
MKKGIALISTLFVLVLGISSCGRQNGTPNNNSSIKEVRFGSFSVAVDYGPYLIAKNQGWFEEVLEPKGIEAKYELFQSLPPINESLATDRIDVVFQAAPPAIVGKAAGIGVEIVGISSTLVQEILVSSNSTINSAKDLKGQKIAVLAGSSSHYGLLRILDNAGVKASDVEVIDLTPPDAKNAFQTGQVTAWAVWPPFVEQEEIAGTGRVLPQGDAYINSIMAVRSKFAQENPQLAQELVDVLERSKQWMIDNPDQAQQIVAQELSLSLEVIQRAWPRHDWTAQLTPEVVQDIQAKADFLLNTDFIQNQVNASELVNTSFSQSNQQSQIIFTDPISLLPQLPIFPTLIPNAQ